MEQNNEIIHICIVLVHKPKNGTDIHAYFYQSNPIAKLNALIVEQCTNWTAKPKDTTNGKSTSYPY